ncbi:MAG: RimK family alpha-L-glutamate ligase [Candidatus Nanohalobium sp.]
MADRVASLWDSVRWDRGKPFGGDEETNRDYEAYSELARENDVEFFVANYRWYSDGVLDQAWHFDGERWEKLEDVEINGVYDKFKFDDETREIKKRMLEEVPVLNHYGLERVCKDKYLTYQKFKEYIPETRKAPDEDIVEIIEKYGKAVLKPRYDYGGKGIKVIESLEEAEKIDYSEDYIVQAFVDSSSGISELDIEGLHDLRAVIVNDEIAVAYVRQPSEGYLSNQHLGGTVTYVEPEEYPEKARHILEAVSQEFEEYDPRLYTVDLIFDKNGEPWILELNSKPGIGYAREQEKREYEYPAMKKVVQAWKNL